jgi:hypothetical protein
LAFDATLTLNGTEIMIQPGGQTVSVCAHHVGGALGCLGITLLSAALACGGTLGANSYQSWQWNGFSRSSFTPDYSPSSLYSKVLSSWSSDTVVSESMLQSSVASSVSGNAILSGVVYDDANGNGIRESSDWGIRDATVALTSTNSNTVVTAVTDYEGAYSFKGLTPGDYTISLLTPSTQPEKPSVGSLADAGGNTVSFGLGAASGQSIADIQLQAGYSGSNYDFPQLAYPLDLISKRMLLNDHPGVNHTSDGPLPSPPIPPVPEPTTLVLLIIASFAAAGFARRHRN